jgi:hypothetical protein
MVISRIHPAELCKLAAIPRRGALRAHEQQQRLRAWLTEQGIGFVVDVRGWPVVLESALEAKLAPGASQAKEEWTVNVEALTRPRYASTTNRP